MTKREREAILERLVWLEDPEGPADFGYDPITWDRMGVRYSNADGEPVERIRGDDPGDPPPPPPTEESAWYRCICGRATIGECH